MADDDDDDTTEHGSLFEVDGYHIVLAHVQNVYPVEKDKFYYEWGFKYTTGIFEFFTYIKPV